MTIKVYGGGGSSGGALSELTRFMHQRVTLNAALSGEVTYQGLAAAFTGASPFTNLGAAPIRARLGSPDQRYVYQVNPTLVAGSGQIYKGLAAQGTVVEMLAHFRDTIPAIEAAMPASQAYASICQAWLRKSNNVNPCWARMFFGFGCFNLTPIGASASHARVGVMGDGNNGFRLGSVHCPDGLAAGQSSAGAIDNGFVQPPTLVNPGLNWFHIRVKMCPATPVTPPRVGIYLDGALQVAFNTNANFPRGQLASNDGYRQVEAAVFADFDGATQLNGWQISDWEVWYDTDLTL